MGKRVKLRKPKFTLIKRGKNPSGRFMTMEEIAEEHLRITKPPKRITANTSVVVGERGKTVTKPIKECLPPKTWFDRTAKGVERYDHVRYSSVEAVVGNIWWKLSPKKKLEIMKREGKFKRFA